MVFAQSPQRVEKDWSATDEISSRSGPRNLDARFDDRIGLSTRRASVRSPHSLGQPRQASPTSLGSRILRRLTRFSIAVLIGVGATLGWQFYGDRATEMFVARAPTLARLFSIVATKPPVVAAAPPASAQQLESLASNLDVVRRSVELLSAKQEQMAQNIATLQAVGEDIRQKMSYTPPPQQAVSIQQHQQQQQQKPLQPRVQSSPAPRPQPPAGAVLPPR
jgi:hypothetical protein